MKPDFSGWASKAGILCTDGRTILAHAFKGNHGTKVPLLWNHMHDDPEYVLGHAVIEDRPEGTYVQGFFNKTPKAIATKQALQHGDLDSLSVFANKLIQKGTEVVHGVIKEVSLVLAGANAGAKIENVALAHGDGTTTELDDEAVITMGLQLEHADSSDDDDAEFDDETVAEVYNSMNSEQQELLHYMVSEALQHSDEDDTSEDEEDDDADSEENEDDTDSNSEENDDDSENSDDEDNESDEDDETNDDDADEVQHSDTNNQENDMTHRVFDQNATGGTGNDAGKKTLSHSELKTIIDDAKKPGMTLASSFLAHAGDYGIDDIDFLFPDAKAISNTPEFLSRRMEWVSGVIDGTRHTPFSRLKSIVADITADEARAKGYVTGEEKTEEVFNLLRRVTTPTTVYKKQKLDRDDILDITDIDVVAWLKAEMRLMLEEEIARAILIGDGRAVNHADKIKDPAGATEGAGIRSIYRDHNMYAHQVELTSGISVPDRIKELIRARVNFRGSGTPKFYTTLSFLTDMLLHEDKIGHRVYKDKSDLASALMVSDIVTVEPMEEVQELVGIFVNLADYSVGTDKGGQISFFDDFDIDYNQEKYLLETRMSGALVRLKSAVVVTREIGIKATPTQPSFNSATNTITIPSITGVTYQIEDVDVTGTEVITEDTVVNAVPATGYYFPTGTTVSWTYTFNTEA